MLRPPRESRKLSESDVVRSRLYAGWLHAGNSKKISGANGRLWHAGERRAPDSIQDFWYVRPGQTASGPRRGSARRLWVPGGLDGRGRGQITDDRRSDGGPGPHYCLLHWAGPGRLCSVPPTRVTWEMRTYGNTNR